MKSQIFNFPMTLEQSMALLEQTKTDQDFFRTIIGLSQQMKKNVNEDDLEQVKQFFDKNTGMIPFLRIFIDESFEQAVLFRYEEIIKYFLENGYQVSNKRVLRIVIKTSRFLKFDPPVEVLNLLIDFGADINENKNEKYQTPLHLACKYGIQQFIKILIEKGADINAIDKNKFTPLMYLQKQMNKEGEQNLKDIEKYMYKKGAEIYVTSMF